MNLMKNIEQLFDNAGNTYQKNRIEHWNRIACKRDRWQGMGKWYHRRLEKIYKSLITPRLRVIEIGCGKGNLLAAVQPSYSVGGDFSPEMIERGRKQHPGINFVLAEAHDLSEINGTFDVVILSNLINDLWDVHRVFNQIAPLCHQRTRLIVDFYSHLWQFPLNIAQSLNLANLTLEQNWLTREDLDGMLRLAGFETIRSLKEVLWPLPLGEFANRILVRFWPFNLMALANIFVARPSPKSTPASKVSVIIPARNESGNIKAIFDRVPKMGLETELVFVEGHSKDDTYEMILREIEAHPKIPSRLFQQSGIGKADAVRLGFSKANGDVLMILDADLTVPPEDLPHFYEALTSGTGEFINGVRLVYPMEKEAMRMLNLLGNKIFSLAFSWILGQPIKDTLCGTKVLRKKDYELIVENRSYFGDFDPFGDHDLIFGAAKLNLKIIDFPIRYRERTYGTTNISRWKHGLLLLRMVAFAARRIKFV